MICSYLWRSLIVLNLFYNFEAFLLEIGGNIPYFKNISSVIPPPPFRNTNFLCFVVLRYRDSLSVVVGGDILANQGLYAR